MSQSITVGISDLNVAGAPDLLVTYALGSCVGICLYDPITKIGGLAHIMLPDSTAVVANQNPNKFADTATVALVRQMLDKGADRRRIRAKIAGGAQMFAAITNSSIANIGARNTVAVKEILAQLSIPVVAEDTGKNYGRTLYFSTADGSMRIKSAIKGEWVW